MSGGIDRAEGVIMEGVLMEGEKIITEDEEANVPSSSKSSNRSQSINSHKEIPRIFKLTIDCINEIFEYLSSQDMLILGQTCKTMQKVVGEYAKSNYMLVSKFDGFHSGILSIPSFCSTVLLYDGIESIQISGFNEFIKYIRHNEITMQPLRFIELYNGEFNSVIHLHLNNIYLDIEKIKIFKNILNNLEILEIRDCQKQFNFYDACLKHCGNLKRLYIKNLYHYRDPLGDNWLPRYYPFLDHLEWIPPTISNNTTQNIIKFFKLNPGVRSFSTSFEMLEVLLVSNNSIELDVLEVKLGSQFECQMGPSAETVFRVINQLYDQKFYKRLHLHLSSITKNCVNRFFSLKGLEKVCIEDVCRCYDLPLLTSLKELTIMSTTTMINMNNLAEGLVNIQRLNLHKTNYNDILPFIRHSTKLQRIIVKNETNFCVNRPNISALNKERKKLKSARKITIFVGDTLFVNIKWATKNGQMDFELVEFKRSDSYRWDHHC